MKKKFLPLVILCIFSVSLVNAQNASGINLKKNTMMTTNHNDTITFGAGCFWCVEAVYQQVKGVIEVTSGYAGGDLPNPDYQTVCSGESRYAEVCRIVYNPEVISFSDLLRVFWQIHNPTTLNRQGADVGPQYRSVIFYHTPEQENLARAYKEKLNRERVFPNPVVTEISPVKNFYPAEDYHQNYYNKNRYQSYCQMVIAPKLEKFNKVFGQSMKKNE